MSPRERDASLTAIELDLPDVTLCCVDTRLHALALRSLARSRRGIRFARVLFLTHDIPPGLSIPLDVEVRDIGPIASRRDYCVFVIKGLADHLATSHALVTQWDGYAVRPDAWRPEFLQRDYIGAVWRDANGSYGVGNGGFSLRSRRLLDALRDDRFQPALNEDQDICGTFRPDLEREFSITFADEAMADAFSFEGDPRPWLEGRPVFGFHGLFNLFLTEPQEEIAAMADALPDAVLRSSACRLLLSNCVNYKQWDAAIALGSRMLEADSEHEHTAELVTAARTMLAAERRASSRAQPSMLSRVFGRRRERE